MPQIIQKRITAEQFVCMLLGRPDIGYVPKGQLCGMLAQTIQQRDQLLYALYETLPEHALLKSFPAEVLANLKLRQESEAKNVENINSEKS